MIRSLTLRRQELGQRLEAGHFGFHDQILTIVGGKRRHGRQQVAQGVVRKVDEPSRADWRLIRIERALEQQHLTRTELCPALLAEPRIRLGSPRATLCAHIRWSESTIDHLSVVLLVQIDNLILAHARVGLERAINCGRLRCDKGLRPGRRLFRLLCLKTLIRRRGRTRSRLPCGIRGMRSRSYSRCALDRSRRCSRFSGCFRAGGRVERRGKGSAALAAVI